MFPSSRARGGGRVDFHPGRGGLFRIVEGDGGGKRKVQRACLSGALGWFKFRWNPARERVGSCEAVGTIRQVGRHHAHAHAHAYTHRERRVEDKGRSCNAHSEWRIELGITTVKSSRDKRRSLHPIGLCILPGRRPSHPSIRPSIQLPAHPSIRLRTISQHLGTTNRTLKTHPHKRSLNASWYPNGRKKFNTKRELEQGDS